MIISTSKRVLNKRYANKVFLVQTRNLYGMFHSEGRADPVFKPQYDEHGQNLNHDNVWHLRPCPPCSITGKPRRQLGHYPKMGHPIVPYHRLDYKTICDNQRTPMPWFDEPPMGVSLKEMNWLQMKILAFIALWWWLYVTKHFFREADELFHQANIKEYPFPNPLFTYTPNYWYRPNNPGMGWMSCNDSKQLEQRMVWHMHSTKNNTGVFFNMWLEPLEYDRNGDLLKGKYKH